MLMNAKCMGGVTKVRGEDGAREKLRPRSLCHFPILMAFLVKALSKWYVNQLGNRLGAMGK